MSAKPRSSGGCLGPEKLFQCQSVFAVDSRRSVPVIVCATDDRLRWCESKLTPALSLPTPSIHTLAIRPQNPCGSMRGNVVQFVDRFNHIRRRRHNSGNLRERIDPLRLGVLRPTALYPIGITEAIARFGCGVQLSPSACITNRGPVGVITSPAFSSSSFSPYSLFITHPLPPNMPSPPPDWVKALQPSGPQGSELLAQERAQSNLNVEKMSELLHTKEALARQQKLLEILQPEQVFDKSQNHTLGRVDRLQRSLAKAKRLQQLAEKYQWNMEELHAANDLIGEPTPYGLHASMFLVSEAKFQSLFDLTADRSVLIR